MSLNAAQICGLYALARVNNEVKRLGTVRRRWVTDRRFLFRVENISQPRLKRMTKRGFIHTKGTLSQTVQTEAFEKAGIKIVFKDEMDDLIHAIRRDDEVHVVTLRGLASNRKEIFEALRKIHARGAWVVDIDTGRKSNGPDLTDLIEEAMDALVGQRRGNNPKASEYGKIGQVASIKVRVAGHMPLSEAQPIWADKELSTAQAMAIINGNPNYKKEWSQSTLYRSLGAREAIPGRRSLKALKKVKRAKQRRQLSTGAVYFIRDKKGGPVKIGFSTNVEDRLSTLQTSHHGELYVMAAVAGAQTLEREMHATFKAFRLKGEWFKFQGPLRKYIESLPRFIQP